MMKRILQALMGKHKALTSVAVRPTVQKSQSITVNNGSAAKNTFVTKSVNPSTTQSNIPLDNDPYKHLRQNAIETRLIEELLDKSDEASKLGRY